VTDPVTTVTNVVAQVSVVMVLFQHLAAGLKNLPAAWGNTATVGSGSGWYKFFNALASYPGNANPSK
jgi:hypothetical protein